MLADSEESLRLNCTLDGVFLAGVPLLRKQVAGLQPRPLYEISALMNGAFGGHLNSSKLIRGLDVVARALDRGDIGRALIATLHLRLPELSEDGAIGLAKIEAALAKYSPEEPRDERGRWTSEGSGRAKPVQSIRERPQRRLDAAGRLRRQPQLRPASRQMIGEARLIPVSNMAAANDNLAEGVCWAASRHCQITALQDKSRSSYFAACQKAEDVCLLVLPLSRLKPDQPLGVIFPDKTVVSIQDGTAMITHVSGIKLKRPIK